MWKLGARNIKSAVRTKKIEEKVPHAEVYLKNLLNAKMVEVSKKGSAHFILDYASSKPNERYLYLHPDIKIAREKRSTALLNHIQDDHSLLILSLKALGLDEKSNILEILNRIEYLENQDKDAVNLQNYNKIIEKMKENKIVMKGYDELKWKRGSHSWFLNNNFIIECS